MASADVRDILDLGEEPEQIVTKDSLFNDSKKKQKSFKNQHVKKPTGMPRELWSLLWTDSKDPPTMVPTESNLGYKQPKAKIGRSKVRSWCWMPFTNPARNDGAVFHHWQRAGEASKEYLFAKFNKKVDIVSYSDSEYLQHLTAESWTRKETDYLMEMCKQYDLRFIIIQDRWNRDKYSHRSVEDIKERYYNLTNTLTKVRAPEGTTPTIKGFDADHERKRKEQLNKLFNRSQEEVEEEQMLIAELKKIELRKKEREKKTQDLQKLITAADTSLEKRAERKTSKKKLPMLVRRSDTSINSESSVIRFPDFKSSGVSLRSQRMKLPLSVGQKKTKAIEQILEKLGIDKNPIPTEEIVHHFNELRQDIVLMYDLKLALSNCEYELQMLGHCFEQVAPSKLSDIGSAISFTQGEMVMKDIGLGDESPTKIKKLSEEIDLNASVSTPNRKRKAALEQQNVMRKIKQKV